MTYFDDVAQYNQERWEELAAQGLEYTRPILDLDAESALALVDPKGVAGDVSGKDVLCLAGAGGQQSAAFGILGAKVTVLDITETQLERDREAAAHYGIDVRTVQGDMRDLSVFDDGSFDLVHQAHSINFIPEPGVGLPGSRPRAAPRRTVRAEVLEPIRPLAVRQLERRGLRREGPATRTPSSTMRTRAGSSRASTVPRRRSSAPGSSATP